MKTSLIDVQVGNTRSLTTTQKGVLLFLRLSVSAGFLSAVADRFGWWGNAGEPGVAWGDWGAFLKYVKQLNPLVPDALIPTVGIAATAAELIFPFFLLSGLKLKLFGNLSGALLLCFALAMMFTSSIKAPLDMSVFATAGAAFAIAVLAEK
jgi:thiosulfate dehydrogenase (quinone) large subunit